MGTAALRRLRRSGGVLLAGVLLANVVAEVVRALRDAFNTDFLSSFFAAADMLRHGDHAIYCSACLQAHTQQLLGTGVPIFPFQYDNPPIGAWMLQPLTYLSPRTALGIFLAVSLAAVAVAAWLLLRDEPIRDRGRALTAVAALASLPAAMSFAYGQWDPLLLPAAAGAYLALRRDREVLAGILLSVMLLKPQLVWFLPIVMAIGGRWRVVAGVAIGGVVAAGSTVAILGWSGAEEWLHQISPNIVARPGTSLPHMLVVFGAGPDVVLAVSLALGAGAALALVRRRAWVRALSGEQLVSSGLLLSTLAAPHLLPYDLLIAAPVLVLWSRDRQTHALVAALALSAAFLVDIALPASWAVVEAATLAGVAVLYVSDMTPRQPLTRRSGGSGRPQLRARADTGRTIPGTKRTAA